MYQVASDIGMLLLERSTSDTRKMSDVAISSPFERNDGYDWLKLEKCPCVAMGKVIFSAIQQLLEAEQ